MNGPVVLVVAPDQDLPIRGFGTKDFLGRMPNMGVLYLTSVIEQHGGRVVTLDRQHSGQSLLALATEIAQLRPSLVGFTLYDVTAEPTRRTIALLRLIYKGPIVVGGYTPTFHAEDILEQWPAVDYVVVREGEHAVVALIEHLAGTRAIAEVPNLVYRDGGGIHRNPEGPLVDVARLPWPHREWPEAGDVTPLVTRRGCLSRCSFCSMVPFYDTTLGPIVRWRDPVDVVDEVASCVDRGSREFMLYDDDFGLSSTGERQWAERFLRELEARRLPWHWGVELRVTDVIRGASLLRAFCDVGLTHISLGMESMLPRQLKLYNKGYRQEDVYRAVEIARSLPLDFQTNVIFWDPWLTLPEAAEHVKLLDAIRIQEQLGSANFPFFAGVLLARRGTRVHDMLAQAGLLRRRPESVCEYEYDFVDPKLATFHHGPYMEFMRRARAVPRPPALWLFVPRLEHGDRDERAAALRRGAAAVATAEFAYFRALIEAAAEGEGALDAKEMGRIHETFSPELDACASLLSDAWRAVAVEAGPQDTRMLS